MSPVPAVSGPMWVADLGPTYMHGRIFVLTADVQLYCRYRGPAPDAVT
jgi:hypothetical protein